MQPVFFFIPNVIDYIRIILLGIACYTMKRNYITTLICYISSQLLDAFDGYTARMFNQCSTLGYVLDMLIDRCSTLCFLIYLPIIYPSFCWVFQLLAVLDIFSHWAIVYNTLLYRRDTHKNIEQRQSPILYYYYNSKIVLFLTCAGNEAFLLSLYASHHSSAIKSLLSIPTINKFTICALITFPIFLFKQVTNVAQARLAMIFLAKHKMKFQPKND